MKLQLTIHQKSAAADFRHTTEQSILTLANHTYEATLLEPVPGMFTVLLAGKVYNCALERTPTGATEVIVNGHRIPVSIQDPKRLRHGAGAEGQVGGRATLTAPMPGKVVRLLAAVGDEVTEGQGLLVVEAMKMQNEVAAPKAGKVAELKVIEGQTVNAGEVLAIVE